MAVAAITFVSCNCKSNKAECSTAAMPNSTPRRWRKNGSVTPITMVIHYPACPMIKKALLVAVAVLSVAAVACSPKQTKAEKYGWKLAMQKASALL